MSVSTECRSCRACFLVEESILGQSVQCPKCGNAFTAVAQDAIAPGGAFLGYQKGAPHNHPPVSAVGPSGDYQELDIRRGGTSDSWRATKAGLTVILICTIVALVVWALMGLIVILDSGSPHPGQYVLAIILVYTHPILVLAAFVGLCLCWTAPYPPARKRAGISTLLIIGSVVFLALVLIRLMAMSPDSPEERILLLMFGLPSLVVIGAMVYWYLFLVAVADFFRDASLRMFAILTMILTLAIPSLWVLFVVILHFPGRSLGLVPRS
ncbi:MAG TPA: MJ0042-type zinc finger domain-containing protein [Lacunisphaera sp.]|nr:MJ0042-type zinc finger domain-containing protein [Lacunisphaera sp.]